MNFNLPTSSMKLFSGFCLRIKDINREDKAVLGAVPLAGVGQCHPHLGGKARPTFTLASGAKPGWLLYV